MFWGPPETALSCKRGLSQVIKGEMPEVGSTGRSMFGLAS